MRYQYFILVIPATKQMASSGIPGVIKRIGSQNLDLWSIEFCVSSRLFFPINLTANFSPNLSPIKNKTLVEIKTAMMFVIKAIFAPNNAMPNIANVVFKSGTKQKAIKATAKMIVYTTQPYRPLWEIMLRNFDVLVMPMALKIKNNTAEIAAKDSMTNKIFNHFFIIHAMLDMCLMWILLWCGLK